LQRNFNKTIKAIEGRGGFLPAGRQVASLFDELLKSPYPPVSRVRKPCLSDIEKLFYILS